MSASGWSGLSMKPIATLPNTPSCRSFQLSDTRPIEPSCTATFLPARSLTDAIEGWPSTIQPPSQPLASTCMGEPLLATCRVARQPAIADIDLARGDRLHARHRRAGTSPAPARCPSGFSRVGHQEGGVGRGGHAPSPSAPCAGFWPSACARRRWRARRTPRQRWRGLCGATSMTSFGDGMRAPKRKAHANHRILHAGCLPHKGLPVIGCSHE